MAVVLFLAPSLHAQIGAAPPSDPPRRIDLRETRAIPLLESGLPGNPPLPVVEGMINGRGPFRFGIETGAGFIGLNPGVAARAGLSSSSPDAPILLDSISLPGATFHGVLVTSLPRPATGIDVLLGLPFFENLLLTVDYPGRAIRFELGSLPAPTQGSGILPMMHIGPFWGVSLDLGGYQSDAVIDTRSSSTFSVRPRTADSLTFLEAPQVAGIARGAGFEETSLKRGTLAAVAQLAGFTFRNPVITIHPLPSNYPQNPIIGSGVLSQFRVTVDQRNQRVRFARDGGRDINLTKQNAAPVAALQSRDGRDTVARSDAPRRLGTALAFINGGERIRVDLVQPGSLGERVGLKLGDEIVEINGIPVQRLTEDALGTLIRGPDSLAIVVTRAGARYTIHVATR